MTIERITPLNRDVWISDLADLGNAFLASIGVSSSRGRQDDQAVIDLMITAEQTEIFIAIAAGGRAVGISYCNVGTGFSCGGNYIWINGVYVRSEYRREGHGAALLSAVEDYGESIDARLIISTRDISNLESGRLFSRSSYLQETGTIMTKQPHDQ